MSESRLEAFSDGVLAIAITLLVIELRPPQAEAGERLAQGLWRQWPSYVAYLVSFVTMVGLAIYGAAFALSWVSAPLALAICGAMALNHGRQRLRRRPGADAS